MARERVEGGDRAGRMLQVRCEPEMKARLEQLAAANGRSLTDEVLHALTRHLEAPPQLVTPAYVPKKK